MVEPYAILTCSVYLPLTRQLLFLSCQQSKGVVIASWLNCLENYYYCLFFVKSSFPKKRKGELGFLMPMVLFLAAAECARCFEGS